MEQLLNEIRISYTDRDINALLEQQRGGTSVYTRHFNQNEEFFLKLPKEFAVPHFPIHHDVRSPRPVDRYLSALRVCLSQIIPIVPDVFDELTYFFDPAETLRPCFFKLYKLEGKHYLYLVRLDLLYRNRDATIVERGTNDITPAFTSRHLYLEPLIVPLEGIVTSEGRIRSFRILQTISQTWIGETGRWYSVKGIWIDLDLTKFFSKLFLAKGKRTYPFYPYLCKYKTICQAVIRLSTDGRKSRLPQLHRAIQFLMPAMESIQNSLRNGSFSEENEVFKELRGKVPETWRSQWDSVRAEVYLNDQDMKEFRVED